MRKIYVAYSEPCIPKLQSHGTADNFELISLLTVSTSARSVRNILQELLSDSSETDECRRPNLQPRSLEAARVRMRCLREIRVERREHIRKHRRNLERSNDSPEFSHAQEATPIRPQAIEGHPLQPLSSHTAHTEHASSNPTTLFQPLPSKIDSIRDPIRLSLILSALRQNRHAGRPNSWFADIRSLISDSIRTSLFSRRSSMISMRTQEDQPADEANPRFSDAPDYRACCILTDSCFHWKLTRAIELDNIHHNFGEADMETSDLNGDIALHVAARWKAKFTLLSSLLDFVPSRVNVQNLRGETFMHILIRNMLSAATGLGDRAEFCRLIKQLTRAHFGFNLKDSKGHDTYSLLLDYHMVAAQLSEGNLGYVYMTGPHLSPNIWMNQLPEDMGFLHRHMHNLEEYREALGLSGESVGTLLEDSERRIRPVAAYQSLFDRGDHISDEYGCHGRTPLMIVLNRMARGSIPTSHGKELLVLFIKNGESIAKMDEDENDVLHQAVQLGVDAAVPILLQHGANITAVNAVGRNAFQIAKEKYTQSRSEDRTAVLTARRLKTVIHLLEPESKSRQKLKEKHKDKPI